MNHGARGAARERKVAGEQREAGWIVKGTGDAHGAIDQIHLRAGSAPRVVQVKGTMAGPYETFGPRERAAFIREARQAGAEAWLAWAPADRKPTRWIPEAEWPPLPADLSAGDA